MKIRKIIVYLCVFAAAASIFTRIIYVNKGISVSKNT